MDEQYQNLHENCDEWVAMGECQKNPNYMLYHCAKGCHEDIPSSFYDLQNFDIDGNLVDFTGFRGKV